jgi:hypothetical protein
MHVRRGRSDPPGLARHAVRDAQHFVDRQATTTDFFQVSEMEICVIGADPLVDERVRQVATMPR